MEIKIMLHKSSSKRTFTNGIHSLLKRADARESANIILPYMWRISLVSGSGSYWRQKVGHAQNI